MPKTPNQQPTAKIEPAVPKGDRNMFIKRPSGVPGSDIGRPKHKVPREPGK